MKRMTWVAVLSAGTLLWASGYLYAQRSTARRGWTQGKGYGWVWGRNDEVGALNTLGPEDVRSALRLVREGKVYDMGVTYDRSSYKWPGHSPGEIMTFRSPEGVKRQGDFEPGKGP